MAWRNRSGSGETSETALGEVPAGLEPPPLIGVVPAKILSEWRVRQRLFCMRGKGMTSEGQRLEAMERAADERPEHRAVDADEL